MATTRSPAAKLKNDSTAQRERVRLVRLVWPELPVQPELGEQPGADAQTSYSQSDWRDERRLGMNSPNYTARRSPTKPWPRRLWQQPKQPFGIGGCDGGDYFWHS